MAVTKNVLKVKFECTYIQVQKWSYVLSRSFVFTTLCDTLNIKTQLRTFCAIVQSNFMAILAYITVQIGCAKHEL